MAAADPVTTAPADARRARSSERAPSGGWRTIAAKELADHVESVRFIVLLIVVAIAAIVPILGTYGRPFSTLVHPRLGPLFFEVFRRMPPTAARAALRHLEEIRLRAGGSLAHPVPVGDDTQGATVHIRKVPASGRSPHDSDEVRRRNDGHRAYL